MNHTWKKMNRGRVTGGGFVKHVILHSFVISLPNGHTGESRYPELLKHWIPGQTRNDKRGKLRLFTRSSILFRAYYLGPSDAVYHLISAIFPDLCCLLLSGRSPHPDSAEKSPSTAACYMMEPTPRSPEKPPPKTAPYKF